jgi:hypothetical protein
VSKESIMTDEKVKEAFDKCHALLRMFASFEPERNIEAMPGTPASYKHLIWLALNGPALLDQGKRDKAMRWLGFIQGAIWWGRLAGIEELKAMNRPDDERG